ncbi:MBL fold metallo-hydrolase [uncultured Shewanella sp.]|uniref:MBL fold metallo-hydrolase n=1 Tax=uncultured Shewanella sp. TaxID=173975 RepID=UPI00260A9DF1|nr:MBL fold metallo-hydrolase [uncultured Shewanella sp.]
MIGIPNLQPGSQDIELYIDQHDGLPIKTQTLEDHPVSGDSKVEVLFQHWIQFNEINSPKVLTYRFNGKIINSELYIGRHYLKASAITENDLFDFPIELVEQSVNHEAFSFGLRTSFWLYRHLATGISFDLDTSNVFIQPLSYQANAYHIIGSTHHNLLIERKKGLILIGTSLHNERSDVVLKAIKKKFPKKSINYIVPKHLHTDHIGGLRQYVANGGSLIAAQGTEAALRNILTAPHTLYPDQFSKSKINVADIAIETVAEASALLLKQGSETLFKENIMSSSKPDDMIFINVPNIHSLYNLVVYLPYSQTLFVSDVYIPTPLVENCHIENAIH